MAIDKIVAEYRSELDGLRKDFDAVKDQVKTAYRDWENIQVRRYRK